MRSLNKIFGIGLLAASLLFAAPHKTQAQGAYVSDQEFYDSLQPYGTWVEDPAYGNVWIPDADEDFRPYATNGYWAQTDYGSTWVSNYPWGWATFHYGRWHYDEYYGWEWIPGHEWAPAWVSWRHGGGYYGWAPLTPGISITLSFGSSYRVPDNYWVCAPERYIASRNIYNYYARPTVVVNIIHKTVIIKNTRSYNKRTYIIGPRPADIQRITRQRVQVYKINNASRPGAININIKTNTINIFRPVVKKSVTAHPARVVNAVAYKQQHPNDGIGKRGAVGVNRGNAAKLAAVAHSDKPDTRIVKVKPVVKKPAAPAKNKPGNPADKPQAKGHQPAPAANGGNEKAKEPAKKHEEQANPAKEHHPKAAVTQADQQAKEQEQQAAKQAREQKQEQAKQAAEQAKQQKQQEAQQAKEHAQQQKHQAVQQSGEQAEQQKQQAAQQAKEQAQQQKKQAAQQAKEQEQQQKQQAAQQAREQAQQQKQQAAQQAREQAQQQKQQAAQQAREQVQQARAQAKAQAEQAKKDKDQKPPR